MHLGTQFRKITQRHAMHVSYRVFVWCVVCVVCGVWCVVCGMWCVVCGVWGVGCGVVCGVCVGDVMLYRHLRRFKHSNFLSMCVTISQKSVCFILFIRTKSV